MAICGCPPGYILDQNGNCVGTQNVDPVINQTTYTIGPAAASPCYWGVNGAVFYPDISNYNFPITSSGGGLINLACSAPTATSTVLTDASATVINPVATSLNTVWGWVPNGGRLTNVGIATNPTSLGLNQWIGLTFCQTLLTTKTYYIGIAGDDYYRLYINGQLIIDHSTGWGFLDWKLIPVTLNAGVNIIDVRYNNSGGPSGLGVEIYDATFNQLLNVVTANGTPGPTDLNQYIIFSTKDKIGQTWQTGETSGYTCPQGYSLNTCNGLTCSQIVTVPPLECCYILQSCDGSIADILVNNDLSAFVDTVVKICPENIPSGGGSGTGSGLPIEIINNTNTLWDLHDCCGLLPPMRVDSYLGAYNGGILVIPSVSLTTCWRVEKTVLNIPFVSPDLTGATYYADCPSCQAEFPCDPQPPITLTECKCFTVIEAQGCVGSITLLNPQTITNFSTCALCEPKCYYLVDCTDTNNYILTNNQNMAQYVGQVVKLEDCPNTCWQVLLSETCDDSTCVQNIIAVFEDCKTCLPPVPEVPAISLRPRAVKPGYYTPGCSPEYTEKVSCNFATQMYNIMLIKRYGLTICCEEDQINWQIKKQLLDFKALYDPELCKCFINSCCPPTCVEVELNVFNPTICPPPTNVVPLLSYPCLPPTNVVPLLGYPVLIRCLAPSNVQGIIEES